MANGVKFNEDYPDITQSDKLYERSRGLIPANTQTLAKGMTQFVNGAAPKYLIKGKGSHVWDVDGNEYIDYNMGVGPISLGYAYERIDNAIKRQLQDGITFSLVHPLEVEVAELIREVIPNAEMVRYSKTGADVTSAAVRLARAYTGRKKILCCGYHGWHDWYVSVLAINRGIPEEVIANTFTFEYNNIESLKKSIDSDTAAVILEPAVFDKPENNFLHNVAAVCQDYGALLIFDEMWTGFRMALGGAQEYFGVKADLSAYSKAVANGMPISILAGRKDIMKLSDGEIFFYTTFGGEALSLAAAKETILEIKEKNVPAYLEKKGAELNGGLREIISELKIDFMGVKGYNFRSLITFDPKAGEPLLLKSLVQQELIKRGILWSGFHTISFSHTEDDINYTLKVYREVLPILKDAVERGIVERSIKGIPVQPVFRKTGNFNTKPVEKK